MERIEADDARVEEVVHVTVPRIVDEQSGAVTRKLQKARETFDIENAKIAKRERKVCLVLGWIMLWLLFYMPCQSLWLSPMQCFLGGVLCLCWMDYVGWFFSLLWVPAALT